ncbi:MAG: magnesium transporter [Methylococcales bacterium]|jgi:magnesium transporter|nr:magnesium transporter [Methylococcales bacterium]MBT7442582.1 magnesium transporter [Methylococcales bacterium]
MSTKHSIHDIYKALEAGTLLQVKSLLNNALHPAEIGHFLESLPPSKRLVVWELIEPEIAGDILLEVNDEVRAGLIKTTQPKDLIQATENLDTDDLADLLQDLPSSIVAEVLQSMDKQNRLRLEKVLSYPEDSAGGLMNPDTVTVRADVTLDVVQRYLRLMKNKMADNTDCCIVVNRTDHYLGILWFTDILTSDPSSTVAQVMSHDVDAITVHTRDKEVAQLFEQRNLISAPVVTKSGLLIGRITIDDVVDVIRDEAEHSLMSMAGLDEDNDMFAPVLTSTKKRAAWLAVNLITALLAVWSISLFEGTIREYVALAILMPIVSSMGGIAGSQTLTIVIRGLALGQVSKSNTKSLLLKELAIGTLNGLIWSLFVAIIAVAWYQNIDIGAVIAIAMLVNLSLAAVAGVLIPIAMVRIGIDPALAGSVLLTTVTDIVGFVAFLGLATIYL